MGNTLARQRRLPQQTNGRRTWSIRRGLDARLYMIRDESSNVTRRVKFHRWLFNAELHKILFMQ